MSEYRTYNHIPNSTTESFISSKEGLKKEINNDTIEKEFLLGDTLFTIMEALNYIIETNINIKSLTKRKTAIVIINKFFKDKEFFKVFLNDCINLARRNILTYKKLLDIKNYLDICSKDSKYCSIEYLTVFASYKHIYTKPLDEIFILQGLKQKFKSSKENELKTLFDHYDKEKSNTYFYYSNEYGTFDDICIISLQCIFKEGYIIKKCENCGKYFIPFNRSDAIYCDRNSPQDSSKSCKEYGALQAYKEKLMNDKAAGLYRAIYMQKQMLLRRNPDIQKYKVDFENFKKQSKQWKIDVKNKNKKEEDYIKWLKSIKSANKKE